MSIMKAIVRIPAYARCLVVEDNRARINWFLEKIPECNTAVSPQEALMVLDTVTNFDIIFLDHDCDGKNFTDPNDPEFLNKSFWCVAQRLHRTGYDGKLVIHSANPVGAERMAVLLGVIPSVYILPFATFDIKVLE